MQNLINLSSLNKVREVLLIVMDEKRVNGAFVDPHLLGVRILKPWRFLCVLSESIDHVSIIKKPIKVELHKMLVH